MYIVQATAGLYLNYKPFNIFKWFLSNFKKKASEKSFVVFTQEGAAAVFFKACVPAILIELSIRLRVDAILNPTPDSVKKVRFESSHQPDFCFLSLLTLFKKALPNIHS